MYHHIAFSPFLDLPCTFLEPALALYLAQLLTYVLFFSLFFSRSPPAIFKSITASSNKDTSKSRLPAAYLFAIVALITHSSFFDL